MKQTEPQGASPPGKREKGAEFRIIVFLRRLAARHNRGALATLRRGLGRESPGADALRLLVPHIPPYWGQWQRLCCYQVAALFATHPQDTKEGNLGDTFRRLENHESAQKRFVRLLSADGHAVFPLLRQAIALARSKDVEVNYLQLLKDLFWWESPSRSAQERWARSCWSRTEESPESAEDAASAAIQEED